MTALIPMTLRAGLLAGALAFSTPVFAGPEQLTVEQWQADLSQLKAALLEGHPNPYFAHDRAEFDAAFETLSADIPTLDDTSIILRMEQLVGMTRDGHTGVAVPFAKSNLLGFPPVLATGLDLLLDNLPVKVSFMTDGLFVTAAAAGHETLIGKEIRTIGGMTIEEIAENLAGRTHWDNESGRRIIIAHYLVSIDVLQSIGAADEGRVAIEFGDGSTADLEAVDPELPWTGFDHHRLSGTDTSRDCDAAAYCFTPLPDLGIAYVRMDQVVDDGRNPLAATIAAGIDWASEHDAKLVIDLRDNPGGSSNYARAVLLGILQNPEFNQWGRTYVLTSRKTFSAAQILANELEKYTRAILVGEATGARPAHYGDPEGTVLENSGLSIRISTLDHKGTISQDRRQESAPFYDAGFSSLQWFSGADPALEQVAALPSSMTAMEVVEHLMKRGQGLQAYLVLIKETTNPDRAGDDVVQEAVALARKMAAEGAADAAMGIVQIGSFVWRGDPRLDALREELEGAG